MLQLNERTTKIAMKLNNNTAKETINIIIAMKLNESLCTNSDDCNICKRNK